MFCARCGEQIADGFEICPLCGRETTIKLAPPTMAAAAAPAPALESPSTTPIRKDLQGVGGWLLFFCVGLVILGPLFILRDVTSTTDPLGIGLELALAAFGVVVGIFVWNARPIAFTLLWIYFGLVVAVAVLAIIGSIALTNEEQSEPLALMQSVRSLIYVVIWVLYFRKSERVRATFGRNL